MALEKQVDPMYKWKLLKQYQLAIPSETFTIQPCLRKMTIPANALQGIAEVTKLTDLINSAVKEIISEYQTAGHDIPLLQSTEIGPFDAPHLASAKLSRAIQIVEAACAQLSFAVANPGHVATNKSYGFEEPAGLQVVTTANVADILLGKPDGLSVDEIAKQSGLDPNRLGRILRMLATKHCFQEVKPNVFANNRISMQLASMNPVSGLIGNMTDESFKAASMLGDTMRDPKTAFSTSADDSAFYRAFKIPFFDFYDTTTGETKRDRFAQAMVGWGEVTGRAMLPKSYAWESVPVDSTICDVGGGNGHAMLGLVKKFPQLKVILQDLPAVVQQGRDYWKTERPEAIDQKRVEFVPIDFFADQPVSGCDFYYLRHVLHDWPTSDCLKILTKIRKSMGSSSRLLIHEFVLQHAVRDPSVANQAPEPLLANYGMGRIRLYQQDMNMMNLFNSQERTLQEFVDMGTKTGFKFEKLWDAGEAGLVEFTAV
ncbi:S-adenosyl-L-methionine-dependent methyltransferase [Pholiota conissans]|uniref:S-adenosyl-L-methionine-dependent methyltransferase n=1 Tax=Pholiota conissans TaxID=109636 RepID=A0A9P6CTL6_9AGAR|nr:S-adenosyl-L-methionine-dependent methyltransferase [Pholiota conissans]